MKQNDQYGNFKNSVYDSTSKIISKVVLNRHIFLYWYQYECGLKNYPNNYFSNTNLLADGAFLCCQWSLHKSASEMRRGSAKVNRCFIQREKSFNLDPNKQPQLFIFISIH